MSWSAIVQFFKELWIAIKKNWSGIAITALNYEEQKIDAAKQEKKTEALNAKELQNEIDVRKSVEGETDDDVIRKFSGNGSGDGSAPPKA